MNSPVVPVWILGGFLGVGKTTLLNHLLAEFAPTTVGVLVNDFGRIGVDARLLDAPGETLLTEVNGGQIFCSCVSGQFVRRIHELAEAPVEAVIVEASGLATPSGLQPVLRAVRSQVGKRLGFTGMVTVVDPMSFNKLSNTVAVIREQIHHADLLVINKTDLVEPPLVKSIVSTLTRLNPRAAILPVEHGRVSRWALPTAPLDSAVRPGGEEERLDGYERQRPVCQSWHPDEALSKTELRRLLETRARRAFRIKGFVTTSDGPVFASASGGRVEVLDVDSIGGPSGLTEFYPVPPGTQEEG